MTPTVVVADDHPAFGLGMRLALQAEGFDVVATVETGAAAAEEAARLRPDAVVLDVRMPGVDGIEACRRIVAARSAGAVVMLSTYDDPHTLRRAAEAGARAYLTKETPVRAIADLLRRLIAEPGLRLIDVPSLPELTPRERDVLQALGDGATNKQIAVRLGIGVDTVKDHLSSLFGKLDVSDRVQAVLAARRLGLQGDPPRSGVPDRGSRA